MTAATGPRNIKSGESFIASTLLERGTGIAGSVVRIEGRCQSSLLILVSAIPRLIRRNTTPAARPTSEWNAAFAHCVFTAPGRYLLPDEGVRGLDHRRSRVVKSLPAPRAAVPDRNIHRLVGVHDKNRYEFHAIRGGDAVVTAGLGIQHAVGVAPHSVVQGDVIFML